MCWTALGAGRINSGLNPRVWTEGGGDSETDVWQWQYRRSPYLIKEDERKDRKKSGPNLANNMVFMIQFPNSYTIKIKAISL
jgi:hypothetical protein